MLDFTAPEEVREIILGLDKFVKIEIEPLEKQFGNLEKEHLLYDERGCLPGNRIWLAVRRNG